MIKKRINLRLYSTIIGIEDQNKYNTLSEVVFCKKLPVSALIDKLNLELNLPYHYYVNAVVLHKSFQTLSNAEYSNNQHGYLY